MLVGSTAPALQALAKTGLSNRAAAIVLELVARDAGTTVQPSTKPPAAETSEASAAKTTAGGDTTDALTSGRGVLIASGRGCDFWISGSPYGSAGSVRANLSPGIHVVGCRSAGGRTLVKSTTVKAGKTAYVQF
jgi:hypothetical protein